MTSTDVKTAKGKIIYHNTTRAGPTDAKIYEKFGNPI